MKDNNTIPKGFKMTELGLLPEEWDVVRLGIYCRVFGGYAFKSSDFSNEGTPIIKIGNLQDGTIIIGKRTNFYPKEKITQNLKKFILKTNDVLIALTGATTGKVAVFPKDFESALLNQRVGKFDVYHENLNKLFVRFYSITKNFQEGIRGNILQSAQGNVSPKQIDNLKVPLPPLPEQKKIVAVLSAVQEAKEKAGAVIEAARELKKSLMKYLFTYGPVPMGKAENVPLKETEIGLIPEEWEVVKVTDVFELSRKPRNLFIDGDEEIPFIPMELISEDTKSVNGYQIKKYSEISSGTFVFKSDLIIAKITPSFENGKQAIIDNMPIDYGYATTEVWALHPKENRAIIEHLYSYLKIENVRAAMAFKMEGTTGRQRLPRHVVENLMIPLPSFLTQQEIAEILYAVDKKIEAEQNKKKVLEELFKTLLNDLMTAKIRVNHLEIAV